MHTDWIQGDDCTHASIIVHVSGIGSAGTATLDQPFTVCRNHSHAGDIVEV